MPGKHPKKDGAEAEEEPADLRSGAAEPHLRREKRGDGSWRRSEPVQSRRFVHGSIMTRLKCGRRIIKERMTRSPSIRWSLGLILSALLAGTDRISAWQAAQPAAEGLPAPVQLTAQDDRQRLMDLLHITSLRRGAD